MMNRDFVKARLDSVNQQLQQTLANYNALLGAKQECEIMLAELDKPEIVNNDAEADAA